jgi:hypothetical protein
VRTNTKRKCVSILCIAEQSVTNFNGDGGEHSHPEKRRVEGQKWKRHKKKLVSCQQKAGVAEQTITNFNGNGVEHSLPEKRRVEGQSSEDTKKVSFMSQKGRRR